MANIPIQTGDPDPIDVTDAHRDTSSELLRQLCDEVSSRTSTANCLWVDVGHYEQNGFLNPRLHGFWILPLSARVEEEPEIPGLSTIGIPRVAETVAEWATEQDITALTSGSRALLQAPNASSEESPSVWACVINTSVEAQIESTLTSLALLVARQQLVANPDHERVLELPAQAARVDAETTKIIGDEIRVNGWRHAAQVVRARAEASGVSLRVQYRRPLLTDDAIRERMQLMRHTYNSLTGARDAIDRTVSLMTQSWRITGPSSTRSLQMARDALDAIGVSSLTAHCARDAFVCGVGAVSLEAVPLSNPWLVVPEEILTLSSDSAVVRTEHGTETLRPVLGLKGAQQPGSDYGLSLLEPVVLSAVQRGTFLKTLITSRVYEILGSAVPREAMEKARELEPMAIDQIAALDASSAGIFNAAALRLPQPEKNLYVSGLERMEPSFGRVTVG